MMIPSQHSIRGQFPIFANNQGCIYLDSASTTQKPICVLKAMSNYYQEYCANAGRGSYPWAQKVTTEIQQVREKVAIWLNATDTSEVVFTSGATAGLNTVAYAWGMYNLQQEDEILYCPDDHKSTVSPWLYLQTILSRFGKTIHLVPYSIKSSGEIDIEDVSAKVTSKTKLIALTHIHNVFGAINDIAGIRKKVGNSVLLSLDASQSIGHITVNVKELGIDFLAFSGHKMFASPGIGVLWVNKYIHDQLSPFMVGGEQELSPTSNSQKVSLTPLEMPHLLEAGTLNIAGILTLGKAIDFINELTLRTIENHGRELTHHLLRQLQQLPEIVFLPGIAYSICPNGHGILSFHIEGLPASEAGFILSSHNIFVRTGTHCTRGTATRQDSVRISLHIYNTQQEIDACVSILQKIVSRG